MNKQNSDERKIEFKKSNDIRLKKYCPEKKSKITRTDIVKYVSTYDYKIDKPDDQEELFI